jgi:hypothetical protein
MLRTTPKLETSYESDLVDAPRAARQIVETADRRSDVMDLAAASTRDPTAWKEPASDSEALGIEEGGARNGPVLAST